MEHKIKIVYEKGDSLSSEKVETYLDLEFNDYQTAKDNVFRIMEHYQKYKEYKNTPHNKKKSFARTLSGKDWFVDDKDGHWDYTIRLYTDNNNVFQLHCFWIGYFENLLEISIESFKTTF